ncbi:MAG: flavin reductase [Proteobacteria bacterium]|nr:flavin reductase [Pseudomonadota bacterium]
MTDEGIDADTFKNTMATVAATVTVVTSYAAEEPIGITVSAFTSVSVDPPIVLVCIDKASGSLAPFLAAAGFTVNFLPESAANLAMTFATRGADKFGSGDWTAPTVVGAGPLLNDSYGVLECLTIDRTEMGDHWVLYGRVDAGGVTNPDASPLLYVKRTFARLEEI